MNHLLLRSAPLLGILSLLSLFCRPSEAAIETRSILKTFFETGDIPTEQQFSNLIDSQLTLFADPGPSREEHSLRTSRIGIRSSGVNQKAVRFSAGDVIGPPTPEQGTALSVGVGASSDWVGESGFLGLEFELESAGVLTTHYGFVQMRVDDALSATPFAIHIEAFAYDTTPDTPITAFVIPEPATMTLVVVGAASIRLGRRERVTR